MFSLFTPECRIFINILFQGSTLPIILMVIMIIIPIIFIVDMIITRKLKNGLFSLIAGFIATKIFKKGKN